VERSITHDAPAAGSEDLEARPSASSGEEVEALSTGSWKTTLLGLAVMAICLLVYYMSDPSRSNPYLHFVLQAQAWLDGQTSIPMPGYQDVMPVLNSAGQPSGRGIIPFPPLPAWVMVPFVAVWHLSTNEQLLATIGGALDVGIAYWMLGFLPVRGSIRWLTALFLGLGTVLWYASVIGTTWFWAHVVAVGCLLLSVGLALSVDREATEPRPIWDSFRSAAKFSWPGGWTSLGLLVLLGVGLELMFLEAGSGAATIVLIGLGILLGVESAMLAMVVTGRPSILVPFIVLVLIVGGMPALLIVGEQSPVLVEIVDIVLAVAIVGLWALSHVRGGAVDRVWEGLWEAISSPEAVQVAAGIMLGLAVTARLTILFGFPFLVLVGGGGNWLRRGILAGTGVAIPVLTLLVVTYATSGHLFNPAYDYLYRLELGYPFGYHSDWSVSDIRYIPQNLQIMLLNQPWWFASANANGQALCTAGQARGLFDLTCPLAIPNTLGMSILLTSPAYLFAIAAWRPLRHLRIDRATIGATLAVVAIATVNLMHFSQGWVQFGYRFSNDFVPFALVLVALGASRFRWLWPFVLLVAASVAINFWGTTWAVILGW
jgi:hypothetical protein